MVCKRLAVSSVMLATVLVWMVPAAEGQSLSISQPQGDGVANTMPGDDEGLTPSSKDPRADEILQGGPTPPLAVVRGPGRVYSGETVTLDGSLSSSPNGYPMTFRWSLREGPAISISDANKAIATFVAPHFAINGDYHLVVRLLVDNGHGWSTTDVTMKIAETQGVPEGGAGCGQGTTLAESILLLSLTITVLGIAKVHGLRGISDGR